MMGLALATLSPFVGPMVLRARNAGLLEDLTVLQPDRRLCCAAVAASPIHRLRLAPSCNLAIRRSLRGFGAHTS